MNDFNIEESPELDAHVINTTIHGIINLLVNHGGNACELVTYNYVRRINRDRAYTVAELRVDGGHDLLYVELDYDRVMHVVITHTDEKGEVILSFIPFELIGIEDLNKDMWKPEETRPTMIEPLIDHR